MSNFKVNVARIEMIKPNERGGDIRLTFHFEGDETRFSCPSS